MFSTSFYFALREKRFHERSREAAKVIHSHKPVILSASQIHRGDTPEFGKSEGRTAQDDGFCES
jgi:hypothetical protein